jgi:hypothetical protein
MILFIFEANENAQRKYLTPSDFPSLSTQLKKE